jgi:hypothetical protein
MSRDCDAKHAPRVYIYALNAGFPQVNKKYQIFFQIIYGVFLTFLPKIKDGNSDLANCWRCSSMCFSIRSDIWG